MKKTIISLAALAVAFSPLHGATALETELAQLQAQHAKALAAAEAPVHRRQIAALEMLQRKATQAGDLETAIKIKTELTILAAQMPGTNSTLPLSSNGMRDLPFCREFKQQIFKANDRSVGDELRVSFAAGELRIWGKKKVDAVHYNGTPVGHMGKVALLPMSARSGKLTVKMPTAVGVRYYFIVLETADGKFDTTELKLEAGKTYTWGLKIDGRQIKYSVMDGASEVAALSEEVSKIKAFGFAATVRQVGNEADLVASID